MAEITPRRRERPAGNLPATLEWADRLFNELAPSRFIRELMPSMMKEEGEWMPAFDISETDDHFIVKADIPGIDPKSLDISFSGNVLTIKGEKKEEHEEKTERYYRVERSFGVFSRSFTLHGEIKEQGIDASYKDGVLHLSIPKAERAKHKKIEVKVH